MDAGAILNRLSEIGVSATIAGDRLRLRPGSRVPCELVEELRTHKEEIMLRLKGYRLKYAGPQAGEAELEEIAERVRAEGYVLLWSSAVQDLVAFYRDEESRGKIPKVFVPYSQHELRVLFGEGKSAPSASTLRLVHEAKRRGGRIVSHNEENGQTRPDGD